MQIELDSSAHTGIKMHQTSFSDPSGLWPSQQEYWAKIPGTPGTEYRIFFQISVQKLAYFLRVSEMESNRPEYHNSASLWYCMKTIQTFNDPTPRRLACGQPGRSEIRSYKHQAVVWNVCVMVFSCHIKSGPYCSSSQSQCTSWELGILITCDLCPGHFHMSTVINCCSGWMELITVLSSTLSTVDMTGLISGHRVTIQFPYTSALMNTPLLPPCGGYSRAPLCQAWRMIQQIRSQKFDPLEVWSDTSWGCFVGFNRFLITPRDMNASSMCLQSANCIIRHKT